MAIDTGSASAPPLAVLMALRVKGRAGAAMVARAAGLSEVETREVLERARDEGVVRKSDAEWALTDNGRRALAARCAREPTDRAALAALYQRFLAVDAELKARITAWQLADSAAAGARGPFRGTSSLVAAGEAAVAVAGDLARAVPRLHPYAARLDAALQAVQAGDARFIASPRVESLHQVWFELHEDLLATLGRSRTS